MVIKEMQTTKKDESMLYCQSCTMPMVKEEDFGTNADGSHNTDYCVYCYKDGKFSCDTTMEEMIAFCAPLVSNGNPYNSVEEARAAMLEIFPNLKRWKKNK